MTRVNWEEYKKKLQRTLRHKFGNKRAEKFMQIYCDRYDKYARRFIDWGLALDLLTDYKLTRKEGTRVYVIVGPGGQGKTTLMKTILHFLDSSYNISHLHTKMVEVIKDILNMPLRNSMKAIGLDEPDDGYHFSSKEGKQLRAIIGKWRQQGLFFAMCATDVSDVPPYIFRKANAVIFVPRRGEAHLFRDLPEIRQYVLQEMKNAYSKKSGYGIFYDYAHKNLPGYLLIRTCAKSVLDMDTEKQYLTQKEDDYRAEMKKFVSGQDKDDSEKCGAYSERIGKGKDIVYRLRAEHKLTFPEIAERLAMPQASVYEWWVKACKLKGIDPQQHASNMNSETSPQNI
jgi:energy-coupling factor transporter ATP-binding protein EcfA2